MLANTIISEWKKNVYKPVYWLEGEEEYFIDKVMNYAESHILNESETAFNLAVFYGKDADWVSVINSCRRYPMLAEKQVVLLKEDRGMINDHIFYEVTGAHSPFHQVFWIREEQDIIFFGADDAPQLQQMKHRFVAKYDHDGKKAMELRRKWWEQGAKEHWKFLFYHDVQNPMMAF